MTVSVYRPYGMLAVRPEAIGAPLASLTVASSGTASPGVSVLRVYGPLAFGFEEGCETYDAILAGCDAACSSEAPVVLLDIASPGGEVAGMLECARQLRAKCAAAGKRLIAYTTQMACSAAYALACAADEIHCADTAELGSIGVIGMLVDTSALDAAMGVRVHTITSGARKADGNPHEPVSDGALAAAQARVNQLAHVFFGWVAERRGLSVEAVAALQAGVFVGASAVAAGLANSVTSRADLIAQLAATSEQQHTLSTAEQTNPAEKSMAAEDDKEKEDATRAGLVTASESDDPDKAARAKRALAAYDEEEEKAEDDGEEDKASASADASAVTAEAAEVAARCAILASRPDLTPAFIAQVAHLPSAQLKALVAALPVAKSVPAAKPAAKAVAPAAKLERTPEAGELVSDLSKPSRLSPHADFLDQAMGLVETKRTTEVRPGALVLGVRKGLSK